MEIINFNSEDFKGFEDKEEILLDTGVILGYLNKYDTWHGTIEKLFNNHIFSNDKTVFLCVNPCIINEVTYLSEKPLEQYRKKHPVEIISAAEVSKVEGQTMTTLKTLIEQEVFIVLDGDKNSVLKQIELYKKLGSADAVNASLANECRMNFLTVDGRLANNMKQVEEQLKDIPKVYYTTSEYKDY